MRCRYRFRYPDDDFAALVSRRQPDVTAVLAVLGGVVEEIDNDLFQAGGVGIDPEIASVDRHFEGVISQFDQCLDRLGGTVEDRGGVDRLAAKLDFAEVDA